MRFRYLLIFLFFIFCMIPAVVITVYSYHHSVEVSHQSVLKDATIASSRARHVIQYNLVEAADSLNHFAENPAFTLLPPQEQLEFLRRYREQYTIFEDLYFANSDDVIVASTDRTQIGYRLSDTQTSAAVMRYPVTLIASIESRLDGKMTHLLATVDLGELKKRIYLAEQPGPRENFLPFTIDFTVHNQIQIDVNRDMNPGNSNSKQWDILNLEAQTWDQATITETENTIAHQSRIIATNNASWDMLLTIQTDNASNFFKSLLYRNLTVLAVTVILSLTLIRVIGNLMTAPESILMDNLSREREHWKPLPPYASSAIAKFSSLFERLTEHLHATDRRTLSLAARKLIFLKYIQSLCQPILEDLEKPTSKKRGAQVALISNLLKEITHYQTIESAGYEEQISFFQFKPLIQEIQESLNDEYPDANIELSLSVSQKEYFGNSNYIRDAIYTLIELLLRNKNTPSTLEIHIDDAAPYLHDYHIAALCSICCTNRQQDKSQILAYNEGLQLKDIPLDSNVSLARALAHIHLMYGTLYVEYNDDQLVGLHLTFDVSVKQPTPIRPTRLTNGHQATSAFSKVLSKLQHGSLPPLSLLLVDDNKTTLRIHREILEDMGHTVTTAEDGRQALYTYGNSHFDAMILDCDLPIIDGFHTAAAIREIEEGQGEHLPILGVGKVLSNEQLELCTDVGIDDYLIKPTTREEIVKRLHNLLGA